ncbi:MAG: hypothetical protein ABEJ40_06190 [Haloarculaceae archaeon]
MRFKDIYDTFEQTYSYPVERETVIETLGERTIEAPNGSGETIAEIMARTETETYASPRDLFEEFFGHLGDEYIGRKYYDDRGDNTGSFHTSM